MSVTKFTLGLRSKSILLVMLASLIVTSFFVFYAFPLQKQHIISSFTRAVHNQLRIISTTIVSPLLKKQYATIYENMDAQLKDNPNWKRLKLVNQSGQVIYPLTQWNDTVDDSDILVKNKIIFLDENLGEIILVANYSSEITLANNLQIKLIFLLLIILFSLCIITLMIIDKIITRPLEHLSRAFSQLSTQNFHYNLPDKSDDEVGVVINDFAIMREDIAQYQRELILLKDEAESANKKLILSARVFNEAHDGIIITDSYGLIVDVNPAFCEITGYSKKEVIGQSPRILSSGKQSPVFYTDMWRALKANGYWQGDVWNRKKSGELYAEILTISVLKDNENTLNYIGLFSDITSSKIQQEELERLAHYDLLTQLPNRVLFNDRFNQALAHSKRSETLLAVCFLDLDNFKPVNDNFGHDIGDQLLIQVAKRIQDNVREEDTVSRQGGDEFALLLGSIETFEQCQKMLERIHYSLAQPFLIGDHAHQISASSGVTLFPVDNSDIDTLVRHADQAMYQAKLAGRNRYHLFNAQEDQNSIQKHHKLEEIQYALKNNEFILYYQPKVNMKTGKVFGAEALIRWIHPEKGMIAPLDFLPIIEDTTLELEVGDWVINQALTQLGNWKKRGIEIEVSVNISSHHLQSSFVEKLERALAKHPHVKSNFLQLEILESSALGDLQAIISIIKTCRDVLGVSIALDDFGTGYSSLTHLRNLPIDTIKIDQTFVIDMLDDPNDFAIIDGVLGLAGSFNRDVIAEGVETTDHGLMLLVMGCQSVQGYGIAKPMPDNELPDWLAHYVPNQEWIDCANCERTPKEVKIKLFKLALSRWFKSFEMNIQSSPSSVENWPVMVRKECLCGYWIQRVRQEGLFDILWLDKLDEVHASMHAIADELIVKYQQGNIDEARKGLSKLQIAFNEVMTVLRVSALA